MTTRLDHSSTDPIALHWDTVYSTKPVDGVSWFCPHLDRSLALIDSLALPHASRIIDVGAGASTLVDDLLTRGFQHLTALDVSAEALRVSERRLGERAANVRWLVANVTSVDLPAGHFDLWHDRAVLHFLTSPADRASYAARAAYAIRPGGHLVVAGFAPDGPLKCSNLEVMRAGPEELAGTLGTAFSLVRSESETHRTPWGSQQAFAYCLFRREVG